VRSKLCQEERRLTLSRLIVIHLEIIIAWLNRLEYE